MRHRGPTTPFREKEAPGLLSFNDELGPGREGDLLSDLAKPLQLLRPPTGRVAGSQPEVAASSHSETAGSSVPWAPTRQAGLLTE